MNWLDRNAREFSPALSQPIYGCDHCDAAGQTLHFSPVGGETFWLCPTCRETFAADPWAFLDSVMAEAVRAMRGGAPIPCPRPRLVNVIDVPPIAAEYSRHNGYWLGTFAGFAYGNDWDGIGQPWGEAYAAGCDDGRFWRLDDPRPILAR